MPTLATLAIFLVASLVMAVTPGPALLYVVVSSIKQNLKGGFVAAAGSGVGLFVHPLAVAFGLSALLVAVPLAFEIIKFAGAIYLIYLGIRTILDKSAINLEAGPEQRPALHFFWNGIVSSILNPKVALFFLAFLPQFVDPTRGSVTWQILLLGFIFSVVCFLVSLLVVLVTVYASGWFKGRSKVQQIQRWLTGSIFLAFGAQLIFTERSK